MNDIDSISQVSPVSIRTWSEEEFASSSQVWEELLASTSAHPLFMSWAWQHAWWREFGANLGSKLEIYAAYSHAGQLVGLAPLHMRRATHRPPLRATRLESLGSSWRENSGVFSEFFDFIVRPGHSQSFFEALSLNLQGNGRWHDLVIANSPADGEAGRFVQQHLAPSCYLRKVDVLSAHRAELPHRFGDYLAALASGTRRKVWNHRRRLQDPQLVLCSESQIDSFLDGIDSMHEQRWGKRHFVGNRRAFHRNYATAMARSGALRMSRLDAGQGTISLMYNVRLNDAEFNIQSGFSGLSPSGTSPGYLHFGYSLEQACKDGVRYFDFLAGEGRRRDYKRDFNTQKTELLTYQCIRMRPLAWLYRQYDRRGGRTVS